MENLSKLWEASINNDNKYKVSVYRTSPVTASVVLLKCQDDSVAFSTEISIENVEDQNTVSSDIIIQVQDLIKSWIPEEFENHYK